MHTEGCVNSVTTMTEVKPNASAFSSPNSLVISLCSDTILNTLFKSLVDSGSIHTFIKSAFVHSYNILTQSIPPIQLKLLIVVQIP